MERMTAIQQDKLLDLKARIGEMYEDYLIIVKPEGSGPVAIGKDLDWCVDVSKCFILEMKERLED